MRRGIQLLVLVITCLLWLAPAHGGSDQPVRLETVTIVTAKGEFQFQTEIADTQALREKGLMFRTVLPNDRAMLFDWGAPLVAAMWMRNTYVSLDMLFIAGDGTVTFVAENTKPLSRDTISAGVPVAAVLEVVAGTARRIGLKRGDRVLHPIFRRN